MCHFIVRLGNGVGLWETIRKWEHFICNKLSFVVGNGQTLKFWKDNWCGDTPLSHSFSSLFVIYFFKEAWVWDVWRELGGVRLWDPIFFRYLNDWEVSEVFLRLGVKKLFAKLDDKPWWEGTRVVISVPKLCTRCWKLVLLLFSLGIFGEYVFNQNYVFFFCLGSHLGNFFDSWLA